MSNATMDPQLSDPEMDLAEPIFSHIVERDEDQTADAKIMEARVMGTPITALCGYTWIPSRDPQRHPVCEKCLELVQMANDLRH